MKQNLKSHKTRNAFVASLMAVILCVAMLVGTTFAWFTDSVTSGKNTITAGNLDIEVTHSNKTVKDQTVAGATDLFKDVTLWEPGAVAYENFTVKNVGTLAAKFELSLNVAAANTLGGKDLTEVIKVAVVENGFSGDREAAKGLTYETFEDFKEEGVLAANNGTKTFGVVLYWEPTDNDNAWNANNGQTTSDGNPLYIDLGIDVIATQNTVEEDSFDNLYDQKAVLPNIVTKTVVSGKETKLEDTVNNISVTAPAGSTTATTLKLYVEEGTTPSNITVASDQTALTAEVTLKDQDGNKVTADGSTLFTATMDVGKNRTNLKVYHSGTEMTKVEDTPDADNEYIYDSTTGIVTMTITSFSPFTSVYDKESWANHAAESFATAVDETNKIVTVADEGELALFANTSANYKGYTVNLTNDMDLGSYLWKPISGWNGTFNGNNHTISNMVISDMKPDYVGFFDCFGGTVKNVTFTNASVTGQRCGIVIAYTTNGDGGKVELNNVKVKNSVINGVQKNGALIGFASGAQNGGCVNVVVDNCAVDGLVFGNELGEDSAWQCGAVIGYTFPQQDITVTNTSVNNISITYDPAVDYPTVGAYASHAFIGYLCTYSSAYSGEGYTCTISNNTIGDSTGFAKSTTWTEYCGGHTDYSNAKSAKVIVNGVELN